MNGIGLIDDMIEEKLLHLHTAFLAKVLNFDEDTLTADIQPLSLTKQYGKAAIRQAVIKDVIYLEQIRPSQKSQAIDKTVLCVCCERDISGTKNGSYALPVIGHHTLHDCIIVGWL